MTIRSIYNYYIFSVGVNYKLFTYLLHNINLFINCSDGQDYDLSNGQYVTMWFLHSSLQILKLTNMEHNYLCVTIIFCDVMFLSIPIIHMLTIKCKS